MKILVICQYYSPEPFRISDICESLVNSGHSVTVLTGLPNYPEGRVLDDYRWGRNRKEVLNGVEIIRCFEIGRGHSNLKLFLNYFSFVISSTIKVSFLKKGYDVVFVNQLSPVFMGIPAILYKKKHVKKMVLYCLDLWPASMSAGGVKSTSWIYKLIHRISKWIYNSADQIMVTSSMFKDYFEETHNISKERIKLLPQYAEDIFGDMVSNSNVTVKDSKNCNFVFAGNIGEVQSVETIIKAANELYNDNVFFHIVGEGSNLSDCIQLAESYALENIKFYGRKPLHEMPNIYATADAMLVTMKNDKNLSLTLPGKVQSYMAAGKPIIGSINGETRRVIDESGCGICCEAEDYKELALLIKEFCDSNDKELMGERARNFYINNYSKKEFMCNLEETLRHMGTESNGASQV